MSICSRLIKPYRRVTNLYICLALLVNLHLGNRLNQIFVVFQYYFSQKLTAVYQKPNTGIG
ncbi:hypothetical protein OMCYN_01765 [cyanobiont of Ornithocercus magnificus]|nr:hypothetical protein OMCYN_01765 [cyanobiont of Ornithocercus magnificus]